MATGLPLVGVGALTLFGASVAWLIAWNSYSELDEECPNRFCVEGTTGGRSYVQARDGAKAAEIMAAIGLPSLTTGAVLLILTIGMDKAPKNALGDRVRLGIGPTGGSMEVRF